MQDYRRTDKNVARYPLAVLIWQTFAAGIVVCSRIIILNDREEVNKRGYKIIST